MENNFSSIAFFLKNSYTKKVGFRIVPPSIRSPGNPAKSGVFLFQPRKTAFMMSPEKAAQYLIVGWVKGWTLHSYYLTVMEAPIGGKCTTYLVDAHKNFPWLPDDPFMFLNKTTCQRYIADTMPKLNDALYRCDNHSDRLKLATRILSHNGAGYRRKCSQKFAKEVRQMKADDRRDKHTHIANKLTIDAMRRANGHAWNVCK